jgi:hypothetical protein
MVLVPNGVVGMRHVRLAIISRLPILMFILSGHYSSTREPAELMMPTYQQLTLFDAV